MQEIGERAILSLHVPAGTVIGSTPAMTAVCVQEPGLGSCEFAAFAVTVKDIGVPGGSVLRRVKACLTDDSASGQMPPVGHTPLTR